MRNNIEISIEGYDNFSAQALELKAAEESIDLKSDSVIREEYLYQKKQERFKKTAFGVQTIVSRKLYRAANLTVEEYFRKKWNISRAQVYRFLDAADVLRQLKDFTFTPRHELLCRTLKHYAKTNEHMVLLWQSVLDKAQNKLTSINSGLITTVWEELVKSGKIVPTVPEKGARKVRTYKKKTTLPIPAYSSSNNLITSSALTEIENSIKNINNISENSRRKINSKRNHDSSAKVPREKESKLFSRRINKSIAADLDYSESILKSNSPMYLASSQPNNATNGYSNPKVNFDNNQYPSTNIKIEPPTPPPERVYYNNNNSNSWNCSSIMSNNNVNNMNMNYSNNNGNNNQNYYNYNGNGNCNNNMNYNQNYYNYSSPNMSPNMNNNTINNNYFNGNNNNQNYNNNYYNAGNNNNNNSNNIYNNQSYYQSNINNSNNNNDNQNNSPIHQNQVIPNQNIINNNSSNSMNNNQNISNNYYNNGNNNQYNSVNGGLPNTSKISSPPSSPSIVNFNYNGNNTNQFYNEQPNPQNNNNYQYNNNTQNGNLSSNNNQNANNCNYYSNENNSISGQPVNNNNFNGCRQQQYQQNPMNSKVQPQRINCNNFGYSNLPSPQSSFSPINENFTRSNDSNVTDSCNNSCLSNQININDASANGCNQKMSKSLVEDDKDKARLKYILGWE